MFMFYEIIISNNSSFEPQHYLEEPFIHIFALRYTITLKGFQILNLQVSALWHGQQMRRYRVVKHWIGGFPVIVDNTRLQF